MKRSIYIILLAIFFAPVLFAQRVVTGVVLSAADSLPLVGATVSYNTPESHPEGVATNERGGFSIALPREKEILLRLSFAGFAEQQIRITADSKPVDLGALFLDEAVEDLSAVTVSAASRLKRIDKSLYFPGRDQVRISADLLSLLENMSLTGLKVNHLNQNASVNGGAVQWQVNGVPKNLSAVRMIEPTAILRIEYSDNPSIRYADKGITGVVNIVLKERTNGGSVGTNLTSAFNTGCINGSLASSYHTGKSEWSLNYSGSYRNYKHWEMNEVETFSKNGAVIERYTDGQPSPFGYGDHSLSLSYLFQPNSTTQYSATFDNGFGPRWQDIRYRIEQHGVEPIDRNSRQNYEGYRPSLDLYFGKTLSNNDKLEINLLGTMVQGLNNRRLVDEIAGGTVQRQIENKVDNRRHSLIGEVNYERAFSELFYLGVGIQSLFSHSRNTYFEPTKVTDKLDESNHYLFANLSGRKGKLQYSVGSGLKATFIQTQDNRKKELLNQSKASLMYAPKENLSFRYTLDYEPTLPSLSELSAVQQTVDDLSIITGNPNLKAERKLSHRLLFYFETGIFSSALTLKANQAFSPIYTDIEYDPKKDMFVYQPKNGLYNSVLGGEWQGSLNRIGGFMNLYATLGVNRFSSGLSKEATYRLTNFYWDLSLQFYYKEWTLSAFYLQPKKVLYNDMITTLENGSRVTLMWKRGNWAISAALYYPFEKDGAIYAFERLSPAFKSTSRTIIPDNSSMITLSVQWNMNFGKEIKKSRRDLFNYDSRNAIIKVQQ